MEVRDVPEPDCGEGDLLLKVDACSLCGTDVRIWKHGHHAIHPPHITGHEICGTVAEVGRRVQGYAPGERVIVVTEVGCGRCDWCRRGRQNLCPAVSQDLNAIGYRFPGGFAEYMALPEDAVRQGNAIKVPGDLTSEVAALAEPLSCVINGQSYLHVGPGDTVAVIGAGAVGCMHVCLARAQGATKTILVGRSRERMALADGLEPDVLLSNLEEDPVARVKAETGGKGADVVIVACSSGEAQEQAIQMAAIQGRVSLFGGLPKDKPEIAFNSNTVHYKEIGVFGAFASYGYQYTQALELLRSGKVPGERFITHHFPLEQVTEGIATTMRGEALKVVIQP